MTEAGSGWSSFAKATALVFGIFIVVAVAGAIVGVTWWRRNGREFLRAGQIAVDQGRNEGPFTNEVGCLQFAFDRAKSDSGIGAALQNSLRLRGCLAKAKTSRNFCKEVPNVTAIIDSTRWRTQKCTEQKLSNNSCALLGEVQEYCYSQDRRLKPGGSE